MLSQRRDVVVGGHVFKMRNHWGKGKGGWGERKGGGGQYMYKQPGTRVDGNRTIRKGGIPSK
jgi:hypothetical protein